MTKRPRDDGDEAWEPSDKTRKEVERNALAKLTGESQPPSYDDVRMCAAKWMAGIVATTALAPPLTFLELLNLFLKDGTFTAVHSSKFRKIIRGFRVQPIPTFDISILCELSDRSEAKDPSCMWLMGYLHNTGCFEHFGIPLSPERAEVLYMSAAKAGYAQAVFNLALIYLKRFNTEEGLKLLVQAANLKHPTAMNNLARAFFKGSYGLKANRVQAFKWYTCAAQTGHHEAMFALSQRYRFGHGVESSLDLEAQWLRACVTTGFTSPKVVDRMIMIHMWSPDRLAPFGMWVPTATLRPWVPNDVHRQMVVTMMIHRRRGHGGMLGGIARGIIMIILQYICSLPHRKLR